MTPKHRAAAARMRGAQLQPAAPALLQGSAKLLAPGTWPLGAGTGFTPVFGASQEVPPAVGGLGRSPGSSAPREPPKALLLPAVPEKFGKEATEQAARATARATEGVPFTYVFAHATAEISAAHAAHPRTKASGCRSLLLRPSRPQVSSQGVLEARRPLASMNHSPP